MPDSSDDLKKLTAVAGGMEYPPKLRMEAMHAIGKFGSHDALLVLLELAGNERLIRQERELALKIAMKLVKSSR